MCCCYARTAQSVAATTDLARAVDFIQERFADELAGFDRYHHSVKNMLDHLSGVESRHRHDRLRRGLSDCLVSAEDRVRYCRQVQLTTSTNPPRHRLTFQHPSAVCSAVSLVNPFAAYPVKALHFSILV